MKVQPFHYKIIMSQRINEGVKRAIRSRLQMMLENEEKNYREWLTGNSLKLNKSRRDQVERKFNKRIQALKIVIYDLTPYYERSDEIPTFVIRKKN